VHARTVGISPRLLRSYGGGSAPPRRPMSPLALTYSHRTLINSHHSRARIHNVLPGIAESTHARSAFRQPSSRHMRGAMHTHARSARSQSCSHVLIGSSHEALGSIPRNSRVPRELTPARVVGLVWSRRKVPETVVIREGWRASGPRALAFGPGPE
jgi:hypothetical protein